MRRRRCTWLLALSLTVFATGACHDTGNVKVDSLTFHGVQAFPESRLKDVLATRTSGWLPWSPKAYFDRKEFESDLKRLTEFYADRGYPHAKITKVGVDLSNDRKSVKLSITVDEGQPVIIDRITLTGFDELSDATRERMRSQMALKAGQPRDKAQLSAAKDAARHTLRENGFAYATVDAHEGPSDQPDHVVIELAANPGPKTVFGQVDVVGLKSVKGIVVHRAMRFAPGEPYKESLVLASQRRLASLQVFDFVHVQTEPPPGEPVTVLPTLVTVTEAARRKLEFGVGYGTEDHFRASVNWSNVNFGGAAQHFTAQAKWSVTLSGVALNYAIPYPFRYVTSGEAGAYAWLTQAPTYDSDTYGGTLRAVYRLPIPQSVHRRESRDVVFRFSYRNEYERHTLTTSGDDELTFSEKIALGFDPATGQGTSRIGSLGATIDHAAVDRAIDPQRGYGGTLHLEHAADWLGSSVRFDEVRFEARGYRPVGRTVAAVRFQIGTILADEMTSIPVSTRYYLGGTSTLRGWGRYEVSPLSEAGEPIGGRSMMTFTAEARFPIRGNFGGVLFMDSGNVWGGSGEFHPGSLRSDVGPGVRWTSPVGVVRGDIGWQLNPIPGLRIDEQALTRRWRIQISIGQAF